MIVSGSLIGLAMDNVMWGFVMTKKTPFCGVSFWCTVSLLVSPTIAIVWQAHIPEVWPLVACMLILTAGHILYCMRAIEPVFLLVLTSVALVYTIITTFVIIKIYPDTYHEPIIPFIMIITSCLWFMCSMYTRPAVHSIRMWLNKWLFWRMRLTLGTVASAAVVSYLQALHIMYYIMTASIGGPGPVRVV